MPLARAVADGEARRTLLAEDVFEEAPADAPMPAWPAAPRVVTGPLDTAFESIFGPADKEGWKPLSLATLFSEGWDEAFHDSPEGTNGAPKQNWIGAPAGVFGRFATFDFFYTNHINNVPGLFLTPNAPFMPVHTFTTGNQYAGYTTLLLPLSSRLQIVLGTVYIDSRKTSPGGHYVGNWGDTGVQARVHLVDQRNFSMVAFVGERIPTGKSVNGSGINYITPGLEFWWNFASKWVVRGGTSINILTGRKSATSVYVNQLALGRYLTSKEAALFKELEVHVTATALSDVADGAGFVDDIYLFPGMRFSLDKKDKLAVLTGVQVPVSGPQAYVWQPQFSLTWKW
ncbi:hypothetical protein OJF2_33340 [Aquisphaera giovannonii]|uniref:Uncharacterized protein n=2 Tax=Aquisphaera giovannonii TaxID=406548 RepID=A0A5B9W287_9BACT|nr:hypothetical protein OJF2_33340 [Aquisphaera giovannonii]